MKTFKEFVFEQDPARTHSLTIGWEHSAVAHYYTEVLNQEVPDYIGYPGHTKHDAGFEEEQTTPVELSDVPTEVLHDLNMRWPTTYGQLQALFLSLEAGV